VAINSAAVNDPDFISRAADKFGNQCIVVSVDAKQRLDRRVGGDNRSEWEIFHPWRPQALRARRGGVRRADGRAWRGANCW
jgi:imidazole glycerol phosphate synthase subunit HisF